MPILAQTLVNRMNAKLDGEGSERYLFDQDFKPAINGAIEVIVTMLNEAFAEKKLTPEALRELVKVKVWNTNAYSRFSYSDTDTGHPLWSILAIYPKPETAPPASGIKITNKSESKFRPNLSFVRSKYSAKRLTLEEWNINEENIFSPGNITLAGGLLEYAYLDPADYTSTTYQGNPGQIEITIRPEINNELVAMAYLKYPNNVTVIGDSIEFPQSLTDLIVDICLNQISYKQGDSTTLFSVTKDSINRLVALIKQ